MLIKFIANLGCMHIKFQQPDEKCSLAGYFSGRIWIKWLDWFDLKNDLLKNSKTSFSVLLIFNHFFNKQ